MKNWDFSWQKQIIWIKTLFGPFLAEFFSHKMFFDFMRKPFALSLSLPSKLANTHTRTHTHTHTQTQCTYTLSRTWTRSSCLFCDVNQHHFVTEVVYSGFFPGNSPSSFFRRKTFFIWKIIFSSKSHFALDFNVQFQLTSWPVRLLSVIRGSTDEQTDIHGTDGWTAE